jgi:hypothetical protein
MPPAGGAPGAAAGLLCLAFNQDAACLAVGCESGFRIGSTEPFKELVRALHSLRARARSCFAPALRLRCACACAAWPRGVRRGAAREGAHAAAQRAARGATLRKRASD